MPPRLLVIHGRTGVGKTLLLHRLHNALDLEGLAQHRSSLFGAVNRQPRTQQWFESHLLHAYRGLAHEQPVWVEGDVILPASLRQAMQAGTCVLVTAPLETRVQRIIDEYDRGDADTREQLEAALRQLTPMLGRRRVDALADALRADDLETVVTALLVDYYDPRYEHAMRGYEYALTLSSADLDEAAARLHEFWRGQATVRPDGAQPQARTRRATAPA